MKGVMKTNSCRVNRMSRERRLYRKVSPLCRCKENEHGVRSKCPLMKEITEWVIKHNPPNAPFSQHKGERVDLNANMKKTKVMSSDHAFRQYSHINEADEVQGKNYGMNKLKTKKLMNAESMNPK